MTHFIPGDAPCVGLSASGLAGVAMAFGLLERLRGLNVHAGLGHLVALLTELGRQICCE